MTIYVLVGMIASGKSTWARRKADDGAKVVCHDDLTGMLHASPRYEQGLRAYYREVEERIVSASLDIGSDVVIDRTHLTRESRRRWVDFAKNGERVSSSPDSTQVVAVLFPIETAYVHASRRFKDDARGRTFDEWYAVACHHADQAEREPLGPDEGFDSVIAEGDR